MLKTVSSITNAIGALNYKGTWNASTNTPTLADGTGAKGDYYVVSTAGTQTFDGILLFFGAGDWIVYNGAVWQRVEGGSDGNFSNVTLNSTDAGATAGPLLDLYRNSATPAASDTIGEIEFNGQDSAGNKQQYALIHGSILSPTSTTEQGQIHFETATAGASTEKMIIGTTNLVINEIGAVFNVRIEGDTDANLFYTDATNSRVGIGTISPASKLDVNGTIGASDISTTGGQNNLTANSSTRFLLELSNMLKNVGNEYIIRSYLSDNNTTSGYHLYSSTGGIVKATINADGTFGSATNTYGSTSDLKLKQDIVDAGSQWDDVKSFKFKKYRYKSNPNGQLQLGVIAQDLEESSPGLVYETKDEDTKGNYLGTVTKNVKYSILYMKAVVALQEAMDRIEKLEASVAELKG